MTTRRNYTLMDGLIIFFIHLPAAVLIALPAAVAGWLWTWVDVGWVAGSECLKASIEKLHNKKEP